MYTPVCSDDVTQYERRTTAVAAPRELTDPSGSQLPRGSKTGEITDEALK
jgi:hypothetical protein